MAATSRTARLALTIAALCAPASNLSLGAQDSPKRYALVIGLNDFRLTGQLEALKFADQDAIQVAQALRAQGYDVTQIVNAQAKREDIVGELNRMARLVKRDDTFVLFFAGHGAQNLTVSDSSTYWLTYDANLGAPDVAGIRLDHLMDYVGDIRAQRKLVLLDHCFSGRYGLRPGTAPGSLDATRPGARGGGDETYAI